MRRIWKILLMAMTAILIFQPKTYMQYSGSDNTQTYTGVPDEFSYEYTGSYKSDIVKTYQELKDAIDNKQVNAELAQDTEKIYAAINNTSFYYGFAFMSSMPLKDAIQQGKVELDEALKEAYGEENAEEMKEKYFSSMTMYEVMTGLYDLSEKMAALSGDSVEDLADHEQEMEDTVQEREQTQGGGVIQDFVDGSQYSESGASVAMIDPTTDQGHYNPNGLEGQDTTKVSTIINNILGAIQVLGSIIAVGALMIIGIRYMAGSIEEKAMYKQTLGPYVVGAILLFAIVNIVSVAYDVFSSIN